MMWEKYKIRFLWWAQISAKAVLFSIVSVLLSLSFLMTPASAQDNFSWKGEDIVYNNRTFSKQTVQDNSGKTFYVSKEADKAHVLVFNGDAKQAKNASYSVYDVQDNHYSNPQNQQTVSLNSADGSNGQSTDSQNSCQIDGIGWIVCPMMKAISKEMDKMKDIIDKYMTVKRISTDKNSTLMQSWVIMRNIANILFIITFLIMIISYITSYGVTNYSIKKTLPRLIVGTILVNFSFYICVIAIDLTNIFGGSIADLFRSIQTQALNGGPNAQISWYEMTTQALAGGAIAVSGAMAASFAFGGLPGILLTLFAAIVGAAITLIVTVIILAGRQALILTLIIISPLAFVANLMPNTEIYFRKWLELLKKLLFIFPIFSVIYGGAQLAGWIIIKEASDAIILLLGMIVQIIPFLILPKLVKDSNTLLSQLGDGLNKTIFDPIRRTSTGYFDRKKAENRAQYLAEQPRTWEVPRRLSQALDRHKRMSEEKTKYYSTQRDAKHTIWKAESTSENAKTLRTMESYSNLLNTYSQSSLNDTMHRFQAEAESKIAENGEKQGLAGYNNLERDLAKIALRNKIQEKSEKMSKAAEAMNFNKVLNKNIDIDIRGKKQKMRTASTGYFDGKDSSEAYIVSELIGAASKEHNETMQNIDTAFRHYNVSLDQAIDLFENPGTTITGTNAGGETYQFDSNDESIREAALRMIINTKRVDKLEKYITKTGKFYNDQGEIVDGEYAKFATIIAKGLNDNGYGSVATAFGNVTPDLVIQGLINEETMDIVRINNILKGRFGTDILARQDKDETDNLINTFLNLHTLNDSFNDQGAYVAKFDLINSQLDKSLKQAGAKDVIKDKLFKYIREVQIALTDPNGARQINDAQKKRFKQLIKFGNLIQQNNIDIFNDQDMINMKNDIILTEQEEKDDSILIQRPPDAPKLGNP